MLCLSNGNGTDFQPMQIGWTVIISTELWCFALSQFWPNMSSYNNLQFHVCWSVLWPSLCIHCFCKAKNVLSASYTLVKFLVAWLLCNGDMQRWITPQLFRPENWSLRWHTLTDTEGVITGAGGLGLCSTKLVVFKRDYYLYTSNHFHAALEETIPFSPVSSLAPGEGAIQASLRSIRRELYVWKRGGSDPGLLLPPWFLNPISLTLR